MVNRKLSRRKAIKIGGLVAGGVIITEALAACGEAATPTPAVATTTAATTLAATTSAATTTTNVTTAAATTTTVATTSAASPATSPASEKLVFPPDFLWGVGTSAYQIEGATSEDGRGESIWDRFAATPGKIANGDNAKVACDHYHLWEQDLDLMKQLKLKSYRFSIAWPRIIPTGSGEVNQKGLDFYKRLVEGLHQRNIVPMATLYHWDLPQPLQDQGGWASRDTAQRFNEYSQAVFKSLGDQIPLWATLNEPWVTAYEGYAWGVHAPGVQNNQQARQAIHYQLLGHGLAVQSFRAAGLKNSQIGIVLNTAPVYPASSAVSQTSVQLEDATRNRCFLDPIFKGSYPTDLLESWQRQKANLSYIKPEDLKTINQPIDFLGLNYYAPSFVGGSAPYPHALLDWEVIYPQGLYDHLVRLKNDYGNPVIYVSENGAAFPDKLDANNQVDDTERLNYLRDHFASAHKAIQAGVQLKGYYVWSLLDNFEWAEGYRPRFGIVYTDYQTQKRYPKKSALWYRDQI